ncbi:hypothetical protein BC829DRAFT_424095 [Chytridium lagenaria]|nr:hypothetical protein BC829DRAFT_424095 [Chytridium lagenaria]
MVRSYLEFLQREGQTALLSPVQATPVFPEKLAVALSYWSSIAAQARRSRSDRSTPRFTRLVALQNVAFCLLTSEAGYRGSDIDRLDPNAITWLPDGNGIHISLYSGKTIKAGMVERIILRPGPTQSTCVIMHYANMLLNPAPWAIRFSTAVTSFRQSLPFPTTPTPPSPTRSCNNVLPPLYVHDVATSTKPSMAFALHQPFRQL